MTLAGNLLIATDANAILTSDTHERSPRERSGQQLVIRV